MRVYYPEVAESATTAKERHSAEVYYFCSGDQTDAMLSQALSTWLTLRKVATEFWISRSAPGRIIACYRSTGMLKAFPGGNCNF